MNQLFYGDNLEIMQKYIADESVDLCYIDPPFNSKRTYNQIYNNIGKEDTAQAQAFIDTWSWDIAAENGFNNIIENKYGLMTRQSVNLILMLEKVIGKGSMLAYLVSMTNRIAEIYRILKPTGSFYLHCDPTMSHYLKLVLDALFCSRGGRFLNEITWCYRRWTAVSNRFQRMHDIVFYYSKTSKHKFNKQLFDTTETGKKKIGRGYQTNTVKDGTNRISQLIVYDKEKAKKMIESNKYDRIVYRDEQSGVVLPDWWNIPIINSQAKERLGYPTQKPESLLERIILASTNEGDVVLDAYCGCGTSVAVAEKLNRKWIGIDITYNSVSLILKRLEDTFGKDFTNTADEKTELKNNVTLKGVPQDMESAIELANRKDDRLRKEFEKWAVLTYSNNRAIINEKKGGDDGIDGIAYISELDSDNNLTKKEVFFSVKSSKNLNPSVVRDLYGTVTRDGAVAGILITLYPMQNLEKESKKYGTYIHKLSGQELPKIQIVTIEEMMQGARIKLPMASDVLKSAERKYKTKQLTMEE